MKKLISLFLSVFICLDYSFAVCDKPVNYIQEGSPAVCTGYLFTPERELEVRIKVINYDKMELLVKKQDELIDVLNKRVQNQVEQNIQLTKIVETNQTQDMIQKIVYFSLGAILTGVITYGTIQAVK